MEDCGQSWGQGLRGNYCAGAAGAIRGGGLNPRDELASPRNPEKRPRRRAAYALPTLFTSGNIFLGFVAILQSFEGAAQAQRGDYSDNPHFIIAAKALAFAVFFDGLDGRIARMTRTTSDFGRELDSLADVIAFGIAPAVLAFVWGVLFVAAANREWLGHLMKAGYFVAFLYLLCGSVRLARFNVQTNPMPKNPGRPDRKYFVGMPIPAGAGFIAAVVFLDASPVRSFAFSVTWLVMVGIVSLLMVSTWRYPSFKQINITKPRSPLVVLIVGGAAILIWNWSQPVLLAIASAYVVSGIVIRLGGIIRKRKRSRPPAPLQEHPVG
ncbi:MAG: CDP-diacylglycerol--serine O-phosphatidyltransferase [Bryobacteraceae bacterium]